MTHYTKNIVLEEVTVDSFERMKTYWDLATFRTHSHYLQAKIREPLVWPILPEITRSENYFRFIEFLFEDDWLDQINVWDRGSWNKKYTRKMSSTDMSDLAVIAANNTSHRNYFDIRFKNPQITTFVDRPQVEFKEHQFGPDDRRIVGYQVIVPIDYRHLFSITHDRQDFSSIQSIWVPDDSCA